MLRLPPFRFHQPPTLDEALAIISGEGPSVRLVAGGTDLWPNMKRRHQHASAVISLMKIAELRGVSGLNGNGAGLSIGATSLLDDLTRARPVTELYPALARATASISSPPLRNMATLGGNLCLDTRCTYYNQTEEWRRSIDYCLKEAGTVCWVAPGSPTCWAHSASDTAPMLTALEATVVLRSENGGREIPLNELYENDGIHYLTIRPGEILTEIKVPAKSSAESPGNCRTAFWKLRRRGSIDFAVLSVAVALWLGDEDVVEKARVVLGSVASRPLDVPLAAEALTGHKLDLDLIRAAARAARKAATPMDNTDFKTQWRGIMVERYAEAALCEAAALPHDRPPPPHL
ncbi:MAG: 4-hydroxybenzoyl-CoA reductase [bacterium]|nr:4-hydroxybenzoyl-CoA reductase [bacterium]